MLGHLVPRNALEWAGAKVKNLLLRFVLGSLVVLVVAGVTGELLFGTSNTLEVEVEKVDPGVRFSPLSPYHKNLVIASERYPDKTRTLAVILDSDPYWRAAIVEHDPKTVVAVVWWFHENYSPGFWLEQKARFWDSSWEKGDLSRPETRVKIAARRIAESGENFLRRYAIDREGMARRVNSKVAFAVIEDRVARNIEQLETKYRLGEDISTGDVLGALGEGATIVGIGAFAKFLHASRATRAIAYARGAGGGTVGSVVGSSAALMTEAFIRKTGETALWGFGVWVILKHPKIVSAFFGGVAESLGFPTYIGVAIGWGILFLIPIYAILAILALYQKVFGRGKEIERPTLTV